MIAILVPTRGRPEQFKRMCESIAATSTTPISIHYVVQNTEDSKNYIHGHFDNRVTTCQYLVELADNKFIPTVHLWNKLHEMALDKDPRSLNIFMLGADDMIFATPGWDQAIIDHYEALKNKIQVYHLQDSRDADGTPHPIVTKEYIKAMGYVFCPYFLHWFVDTWTCDIAKSNNVFTHLKDYMLIHDKSWQMGDQIPDRTHLGIRELGWHQRDKYVDERCKDYLDIEKKRLAACL